VLIPEIALPCNPKVKSPSSLLIRSRVPVADPNLNIPVLLPTPTDWPTLTVEIPVLLMDSR